MTLNHRLLLEALCRLGRATTYALADEAGITRRQAKGAVTALLGQQFILCRIPCTPVGRGRAPAVYEWSGKLFPASSEISRPVKVERVDMGLIVSSINAMVHAGRAAA